MPSSIPAMRCAPDNKKSQPPAQIMKNIFRYWLCWHAISTSLIPSSLLAPIYVQNYPWIFVTKHKHLIDFFKNIPSFYCPVTPGPLLIARRTLATAHLFAIPDQSIEVDIILHCIIGCLTGELKRISIINQGVPCRPQCAFHHNRRYQQHYRDNKWVGREVAWSRWAIRLCFKCRPEPPCQIEGPDRKN